MSIQHCFNCDNDIDTDKDSEHFSICKDPAAVSLGSKGGQARARKYSKEKLSEWAKKVEGLKELKKRK